MSVTSLFDFHVRIVIVGDPSRMSPDRIVGILSGHNLKVGKLIKKVIKSIKKQK